LRLPLYKAAKDTFCPCISETLKYIKIVDKNLISAEKYRILKLRQPKVERAIFIIWSLFTHSRAFSRQTQGHFYP
jgi:hypothetical protein